MSPVRPTPSTRKKVFSEEFYCVFHHYLWLENSDDIAIHYYQGVASLRSIAASGDVALSEDTVDLSIPVPFEIRSWFLTLAS